jgi:hypothetical protein
MNKFVGFVSTTFRTLKSLYGSPKIENERASWIINVDDKEFVVYDFLPLESSNHIHKWRVDSEHNELNLLEAILQE